MTTLPQWLQRTINLDNEELVNNLEEAFSQSLKYAQNYREDPTNFVDAYQLVKSHPAFWWRDECDPDSPWHTNDYDKRVWVEALGDSADYKWALEAGRSVEGDHTHHYHDLRLDVYGIPLEEAYIKLANIVYQVFKEDGTERENIEHLDSPLLKEVQQRLEDWQKAKQEKENKKEEKDN